VKRFHITTGFENLKTAINRLSEEDEKALHTLIPRSLTICIH
jgi:hypothetical protein